MSPSPNPSGYQVLVKALIRHPESEQVLVVDGGDIPSAPLYPPQSPWEALQGALTRAGLSLNQTIGKTAEVICHGEGLYLVYMLRPIHPIRGKFQWADISALTPTYKWMSPLKAVTGGSKKWAPVTIDVLKTIA